MGIPFCCVEFSIAAAPSKQVVTSITYLGVADCDGSALSQGDLFLACHSPKSSFPVPVAESQGLQGVMAACVLRPDLDRGKFVYATRIEVDAMTVALWIKTDANGLTFVTGLTKGPGLPVTEDAVQP